MLYIRANRSQLCGGNLQNLTDFIERFQIGRNLAAFIFADGGAAFVDRIAELLQRQSGGFSVGFDLIADITGKFVHGSSSVYLFHINIRKTKIGFFRIQYNKKMPKKTKLK